MAHRCPVFLGYFLLSPLRKLYQNPERILGPYIKNGMTILEIGPGMGFFTLPMARMAGAAGRVISVDVQEGMIKKLRRRAEKAGLSKRIEARLCGEGSFGIEDLNEKIDFALAFAVVHELTDAGAFFNDVFRSLKPGGRLLIAEPRGHASQKSFDNTLSLAKKYGFKKSGHPEVRQSRAVILEK